MPSFQLIRQKRMTSPLSEGQACDMPSERDVERLETNIPTFSDASQERSSNATQQVSQIIPAEQDQLPSPSSKCPLCELRFEGHPEELQRHVNDHLDRTEEEISRKLALDLSDHTQTNDIQDPPQHLITNDHDHLDESIGPAERMMREVEKNDAALAAALADSTQIASNGAYVSHSLRGSLSDSAERYYPDVLRRVVPLYDLGSLFLRKKCHISTKLDLFSSNIAGLGWDCGYRNIQMMLSALLRYPETANGLKTEDLTEVPSVPEIAGRIERGWKDGYDPEGAKHFNGTLVDKEVWIGATEAFVLLRSLNVDALITDFETSSQAQRKAFYEWIFKYFEGRCNGRNCSMHRKGRLLDNNACIVPPIFCQWQGHSVTIIGAEKTRTGDVTLIILDPSRGFYTWLMVETSLDIIRRNMDHPQFFQPRYQLVWIAPKTGPNTQPSKVHKGMLSRLRLGGPS